MNLRKLYLTKNNCYKAGKKITPKGIMVHSTGANNPNLKRYVGPDDGLLGVNTTGNHWNTALPGGLQVCVHGFIGKLANGSIATYQTLPWEKGNCMRGWHAGKSAGNDGYISFEICEDGLTDAAYFNKVYREAVELCAYLCKMHGFNPLTDIICHSEGYKKGIASNHSDVMHWFPNHGKSMDMFRADVKAAIAPTPQPEPEQPIAETEEEEVTQAQFEQMYSTMLNKKDPLYNELSDVPSYMRDDVAELMIMRAIKGNGTVPIGKRQSQLETMIVMLRYYRDANPRYMTVADCPVWMQPEVQELIDAGAIKGDRENQVNKTHNELISAIIAKRFHEEDVK